MFESGLHTINSDKDFDKDSNKYHVRKGEGVMLMWTGGGVGQNLDFLVDVINGFILDISIALLQVHYYSEALPATALILCRS